MAVRHEKVVLSLEDNFTTGMARAAAATALLDKNLDELSGTSVGTARSQDQVSKSTDGLGNSTDRASKKTKDYTLEMAKADVASARLRKSLRDQAMAALDAEDGIDQNNQALRDGTKDIDRYSGRLRLLSEAALVLGPGLVPIGAVAVPAVVALAGGLAAAATSAGVAMLAFNGVGDALGALDAYQLDPSTAHLEKMREEFEKIGPTGVQFVKFLDGIEPQLKDLQEVARAGIFPGVEKGITSLLDLLPQVRVILFELGTEMGRLAAEAGTALSGDSFAAFFNYLETDAAPTLEAFAHTLGNVGAGLASLIVAFAPLSRDFSSGMEAMSKSFADWAAGLSETDGFRDFVAYVRESGPQVLGLLGSLATAFIGIVQAAAPVGALVVPALTALANVLGAIAASPIGGPLFTAAAAMVALSRAAKLTSGALDKVGISSTRTGSSLERIAGTAAGIAAVGIAVGAMADGIGRIKTEDLDRSLTALSGGDVTNQIDDIVGSLEELTATRNKIDFGEIATAGGLFGDTTLDKYADNVEQVDQRLAQLVESGNAKEAANLFAQISQLAEEQGVSVEDTAKSFDAYAQAVENANGPSTASADAARKLAQAHNQQAASADKAAESTASLVGAMRDEATAALGAFDAETQYREALKAAAAQAKKNEAGIRGNSKAVLANRGALSQLAGAWNNQSDSVKNNVGRWREARSAFIDTATAMGVPIKQAKALADRLMEIPKAIVIKQQNNMDPALRTAKLLAAAIRNIPTSWLTNYTINTTRTGTVAGMAGGRDGDPSTPYASGGFTGRGPRMKPAGIVHLGEVVLPQEIVRRDKSMLMERYGNLPNMGALPGFAVGGFAGHSSSGPDAGPMFALISAAGDASISLHNLAGLGKKELDLRAKLLQKEVDRDKERTDALKQEFASIKTALAERFRSDLFGGDDSALNALIEQGVSAGAAAAMTRSNPAAILRGDIRGSMQMDRLLGRAERAGIDGGALNYLGQNADAGDIRALLANPRLAKQYDRLYDRRQVVTARSGANQGDRVVGAKLDAALAVQHQQVTELRAVKRELEQIRKENKHNSDDNAKKSADGLNTAVANGRAGRAY